ncbi:hypothetical protein [Acetobacter indonesiensis]|uniref:hypothetical protein n=1 Tax=Acetobacter indonesiensis TaxID=104101 RepID=UPI0020A501EC|nr:hypothetical protein [Acetobacter indonesiensis]MCP1229845.1 hypothetical protein [Acetobacter indonesiensis]
MKNWFKRTPKAALKSGRLALDASEEDVKKCMDDETDDTGAEDETPEEKEAREKSEKEAAEKKAADEAAEAEAKKKAEDEDDEEEKKKAQDRAISLAVDSALKAERSRTRAAEDAKRLVAPLVGDVYGLDSADDIMRYALKERGITGLDGVNTAGLRALIDQQRGIVSAPKRATLIAADSASESSVLHGVTAPRKL